MEKNLEVRICTGTLCYVMGGADLQVIDEYLPEELLDKVDIKGTPCLDYCNNCDGPKAPFVKVGDKVISEASIEKVVTAIKEALGEE